MGKSWQRMDLPMQRNKLLEKERLRLSAILSLVFLVSCSSDIKLTPHVPDFTLNETRKYKPVSEKNQDIGDTPELLSLESVDGMYCFPKEEVAMLIDEWNRRKQNEMATSNLRLDKESIRK